MHIGELIVAGRRAIEEKYPRSPAIRFMLTNVLTGAERAEILSAPLRAAQGVKLDRFGAWLMGPVPVVGPKLRELVEFAPPIGKPIRKELAPVTPAQGVKRHRVAFFLGCMMNVVMPDVSRSTMRVLTAPAARS